VLRGGKPVRVRLFGIDCPERRQDFGNRARQFTSDLVFGKVVRVEQVEKDQYGRIVANIYVDGTLVNHELVRNGFGWWYRRRAPKDRVLEALERQAREKGLGLWSHGDPIPPWEWRKRHRSPDTEG
ncbi:MAG: thermonuclease family protein, partial [Deltaproteobacteria bacterium]|nr:thermonuclease family protein [Deltaproteobacteria bacterium]